MTVKTLVLALLSLFFFLSFVNAQQITDSCFPASNLTLYGLFSNITTQASPVTTTERVCGFERAGRSCCDDASLIALKTYWRSWRERLADALKAAYKRFNTKTDVNQLFRTQTNLEVKNLQKEIRDPMKNLINQLQAFYNNFGNNIGACYNRLLPYYAGALCNLCSPSWKDAITLSTGTNSARAVWSLSNSTCDYIASRCSGISLGQYDVYQKIELVLNAMNESVPSFINACPKGTVLYDSTTNQCVRDCSWAVGFEEPNLADGFGFNFTYQFSNIAEYEQRESQAFTARESGDSVRDTLMAFLKQAYQETTDAVREFKLAKNLQAFESRQASSNTFSFSKYSEPNGVAFTEINEYIANGGFDLISYGSKSTSNLDTHAATGTTGQTGSTSGSSHVSSGKTSLPYLAVFALILALFLL